MDLKILIAAYSANSGDVGGGASGFCGNGLEGLQDMRRFLFGGGDHEGARRAQRGVGRSTSCWRDGGGCGLG